MLRTLYKHAQMTWGRMVSKIVRERCGATTTTSRRSEHIRTTSAASVATEVPDERPTPTDAATRDGESFIPSPTYTHSQHKRKHMNCTVRTIATPPPHFSMGSVTIDACPSGLMLARTFSGLVPTCFATASAVGIIGQRVELDAHVLQRPLRMNRLRPWGVGENDCKDRNGRLTGYRDPERWTCGSGSTLCHQK